MFCETTRENLSSFVFQQYTIEDKLGEGTYGIVYKVRSKKNGQYYALKQIKPENEEDGISSTSLREICTLSQIKHPNIVTLFDVVNIVDEVFMIFEYCKTDLTHYLRANDHLSGSEIQKFMYQIMSAVEYLHERRTLHRDLKPANIFIDSNGNIKLGVC